MTSNTTKRMVLAAFFLVLGWILPFFTMQIPEIGNMLLPMHIPVLLCGFLLGWKYGLLIGFLTPLLRSMIFGMPPLYPTAIAMAFELAAYGSCVGIIYHSLKPTLLNTVLSLVAAMIIGRVIWGLVMLVLMNLNGNPFTFSIFLSGALISAFPGILLQLILIPLLVTILEKNKFSS